MFCDEEELTTLYGWIDEIEGLTRDKKNITRDFADGVMLAEVLHSFMPSKVELHNYQNASSKKAKLTNWQTINKKVLQKIGVDIPENVMEAIVCRVQGVVEVVLIHIRNAILKITQPKAWKKAQALKKEQEELALQESMPGFDSQATVLEEPAEPEPEPGRRNNSKGKRAGGEKEGKGKAGEKPERSKSSKKKHRRLKKREGTHTSTTSTESDGKLPSIGSKKKPNRKAKDEG